MSDKLKMRELVTKKMEKRREAILVRRLSPPETRIAFFLQTINFKTEELQLQTHLA